ncbi:MAG: hypothetical protein ABIP49_06550 [Lysobacterales bacterium]
MTEKPPFAHHAFKLIFLSGVAAVNCGVAATHCSIAPVARRLRPFAKLASGSPDHVFLRIATKGSANMLRYLFGAAAAFALAVSAHARFEDRIDVDSANPREVAVELQGERAHFTAADDITVNVTFSNSGAQPVAITRWFVPGDAFDEPLFEVTRCRDASRWHARIAANSH